MSSSWIARLKRPPLGLEASVWGVVALAAFLGLAYRWLHPPPTDERERRLTAQRRREYFESRAARERRKPPPRRAAAPHEGSGDWQHSPPRYRPPAAAADRSLRVRERIELCDGGAAWRQAEALLDTGNAHMTVLQPALAARLALYDPRAGGMLSRPEAWTTLRGVVPGASVRAPVITVRLRVREHEFTVAAAVSELGGDEEVLLGMDVLQPLFASGFRISNG
ncbi:hypothetical protein AB1Y20_018513 [Prymnesium parvum]|uniref:Aspartyl protease n=1 Tax=Prymnesium parvum TaxID=97485 RepID=A0AB34JS44_PRYPA